MDIVSDKDTPLCPYRITLDGHVRFNREAQRMCAMVASSGPMIRRDMADMLRTCSEEDEYVYVGGSHVSWGKAGERWLLITALPTGAGTPVAIREAMGDWR